MRTRYIVITACLILLMTFSSILGCAKETEEETVSDGNSTESVASTAPQSTQMTTMGDQTESTTEAAVDPDVDSSTLVIYSPHDADPMNACIVAFMTKYPDIKIKLVAGGTGELCERIEAESADPQADVFWGGGADSMQAYSSYLEPYICANDASIDDQFKAADHTWIGESPLPMVIIYNKKLLAEEGIDPPRGWDDLLNPALRGKIAYCQPSKSGSAYTQLCTMILAHGGGEEGWAYVQQFTDNLDGKILDSSGQCHKLVASGDYLVGITIEKSAALYLDNPNIGFCYPAEGTSAVPDAVAIVKGCPHEDNARLFVDFVTSYESQQEQSSDWKRRPSRDDVQVADGLANMSDIRLVDYDFTWAADDKEDNVSRFDSLMAS